MILADVFSAVSVWILVIKIASLPPLSFRLMPAAVKNLKGSFDMYFLLHPFFENCRRPVIMGVGSELRNDDGAGVLLSHMLSERFSDKNVTVITGGTAPENFTGEIKKASPDVLFIVDAAFMNLPVGSVKVLNPSSVGGISFSTHMLPLPLTLDYLRAECDCKTVLIGIQPYNTEQGLEICEEVRLSVEKLVQAFEQNIAEMS